ALHEELAGAEAAGVQAAGLVGDLVVGVAVAEHPPALLAPVLFAQAAADAALAIAEPPLYLDVHLKYLRAGGEGYRLRTPISPRMPRYFKLFHACWPPRGGGHACFGARGIEAVSDEAHSRPPAAELTRSLEAARRGS